MIGIALLTGLIAVGCRPVGLPTLTEPPDVTTTTTANTTTTTSASTPSSSSQPSSRGGATSPAENAPPEVEIDLSGLDDLLAELEGVLADVDGAMTEGESQ